MYSIGDKVILHNLTVKAHSAKPHYEKLPPRIGLVVGKASGGDLLVCLRMVGMDWKAVRWHQKPRRVSEASVRRLATPREVSLGFPVRALAEGLERLA